MSVSFPHRVLYLSRGGSLDGSQRQVAYLVSGLDHHRFEPVVVLDRPGSLTETLQRRGVEVHVLPMHPWRSFPAGLLRYHDAGTIKRLARNKPVDLIHATDMWKGDYTHYIAGRLNVPYVVHVRGPVSIRDIGKHHLAQTQAIVVIAERYRENLIAAGINPRKIELVHDGVDIEYFHPNASLDHSFRQQFDLHGRVLVGLIGRIEPFKRVVEFLDVVAPLANTMNGQVNICVVGEWGSADYHRVVLRALHKHKLTGRIRIIGRQENIAEVLASLDILVTMSGGSVMFEAMAAGKTVLSIRTDPRHSVHTRHNETALCVTTTKSLPATEVLSRLIRDQTLRHRLGRTARAWAEQHLSQELMVKRTQSLYERLLDHSDAEAAC